MSPFGQISAHPHIVVGQQLASRQYFQHECVIYIVIREHKQINVLSSYLQCAAIFTRVNHVIQECTVSNAPHSTWYSGSGEK